jgi:hypothetical protein
VTFTSRRRLALLLCQLLKSVEIGDFALKFPKWADQRFEARNLLDIGLCTLAIIPKLRRAHSRLNCT